VLAFGLVVAIMFARRGTGAGRAQAATAVERAEPAD
jgi:hypothetical protein